MITEMKRKFLLFVPPGTAAVTGFILSGCQSDRAASIEKGTFGYVSSAWEMQDEPYKGDAFKS